jgi:hypothetical protein
MLYRDALNGSSAENGLKKQEWSQLQSSFNSSMSCRYTKPQLQSQLQILKAKYIVFKAIIDNSGFGWDPVAKMPTAPAPVWDRYIQVHPKAREFRFNPLLFYEELDEIFSGRSASGKFATSSSPANEQVFDDIVFGDGNGYDDDMNDNDDDDNDDDDDDRENRAPVNECMRNDTLLHITSNVSCHVSGTGNSNGISNRRPSSDACSAGRKKKKPNAIANALVYLADLQHRQKPPAQTSLGNAMALFNERHRKDYSIEESLKVKNYLASDASRPEVFLACDKEEQTVYITGILQ